MELEPSSPLPGQVNALYQTSRTCRYQELQFGGQEPQSRPCVCGYLYDDDTTTRHTDVRGRVLQPDSCHAQSLLSTLVTIPSTSHLLPRP
jgi:hypothetical protein